MIRVGFDVIGTRKNVWFCHVSLFLSGEFWVGAGQPGYRFVGVPGSRVTGNLRGPVSIPVVARGTGVPGYGKPRFRGSPLSPRGFRNFPGISEARYI